MGWREVFGVVECGDPVATQNPQYPQKTSQPQHFVDCANSALETEGQKESKILEALASICKGQGLKPTDLRRKMSLEDVDAFAGGEISEEMLAGIADNLLTQALLDEGLQPDGYCALAFCRGCGPVWLERPGEVTYCPWCKNRSKGAPIPRPVQVECGACKNFQRTDHQFLGHCAVGEPEAPAGLVDSDKRFCARFLPTEMFLDGELVR